ncbi:hypothetical protein AWC05_20930 [Mycobacterium florentinum]|uniref:Biofilm regulator BssS n=1 Tax=Mycobacterium florentinum TaxID=292462 RepID=A0A1X1U5D9_MYCFL|nr:DUF4226 domain-containing protein [Mycobacterium florentinum]MCV7410399.1 DUF4226 domain-containing protein [Mycobacterium florentinum]ORV52017.1 hypothetical protein AWC05_20930 [Mycobacterium florentinum]BBX79717.1 hypothetical protein MFLOJ_35040 [Mycobacterium florentinum]
MPTYDKLLATVRVVRDRTGDPNAWQTGLTPTELAAVVTPTTRPEQLDAILAKIRRQHPGLFGSRAGPAGPPQRPEGAAAEAIAGAEAALAHQNSASSQLDLQVISAIMNAHLKTVEGADALSALQRETEAAVQTRSDLDTPAGARDFQRFLIGKLRDIRAVVMTASLDDTSKSALMAAWTSLYDASKSPASIAGETRPAAVAAPERVPDAAAAGGDPLLDSLLADDPGLLAGDSGPGPTESAPTSAMPPALPGIPNLGLGPAPGPGSMGGWGMPGALPGRPEGSDTDPALAGLDDDDLEADPAEHESDDKHEDDDPREDVSTAESPPTGPTAVTLPDGETVTAASPQLAAAIEAAVGGASIPDAFHQQGITIPAPGTAVANPVDPVQVVPGDIGIFTDRHALALGHTKALLDGQIQHIATVSGPSFLGWEHPPAAATATAPARTDAPTPTRPAATPTTGQ